MNESLKKFLVARRACPANGPIALQSWFWRELPVMMRRAESAAEEGEAHVDVCIFASLDGVKDYLDMLNDRHVLGVADTILGKVLNNDLFRVTVTRPECSGYYVVRMAW